MEDSKSRHRRFSVTVVLLAIIVAGLSAFAVVEAPAPIVDRLIRNEIERRAVAWRATVGDSLEDSHRAFSTGQLSPRDESYLGLITSASDIYRFKLFDADGRVFWSSRHSDIGKVSSDAYFRDIVAKGMLFYKAETKPPTEIDDIHRRDGLSMDPTRHVVEIYTPIVHEGGFFGAIEFYTDVTEMRAAYVSRFRMALAIVSGFAAMAILSVVILLRRLSTLRIRQMQAQAEAERRLMGEQVRLSTEVRLLSELNEWLQSARSLTELFEMVSSFLSHVLPASEGHLYVYSHSRDVLEGCVSWNGAKARPHIHAEECWGLRRGRTYSYGFADVEFPCSHTDPDDMRPYACFPILAHGETVGLLHIRARVSQSRKTFDEIRDLAQMCAEQISMAIANVRMRDQLQEQSVRDPLTGLYNRRHLMDRLRVLTKQSAFDGSAVTVVSLDIDHFKKFNDNHGHDAGDMVLRAVGTVLDQACDGDEIACRMGGEEFMLVLTESDPAHVQSRLEGVRRAVEEVRVRYGGKSLPRITISMGVACHPDHGADPHALIRTSDLALYQAKAKGRNRVVLAEAADAEAAADAGMEAAMKAARREANTDRCKTGVVEAPGSRAPSLASDTQADVADMRSPGVPPSPSDRAAGSIRAVTDTATTGTHKDSGRKTTSAPDSAEDAAAPVQDRSHSA